MGSTVVSARVRGHFHLQLKRHFCPFATSLALMLLGWHSSAVADPAQLSLPGGTILEAIRPDQPSILGTVALPIRAQPTSTRWTKIMNASLDQPRLMALTADARLLSAEQKVVFVQAMLDRIARLNMNSADCSDDGYWAPADETFSRGMGDCFDIAVAKMEALRLLGFPSDDLMLTTGYMGKGLESSRGHESVALLVRLGQHFWLLPENTKSVIEANQYADNSVGFAPVLTYGVGKTWVHGRVAAAQAPQIAAAQPSRTYPIAK